MATGLEGEFHYGLIMVGGCLVKYREYVLPARTDVGSLRVDHLCHTPDHHVSDRRRPVVLTWTMPERIYNKSTKVVS